MADSCQPSFFNLYPGKAASAIMDRAADLISSISQVLNKYRFRLRRKWASAE
jgi:hypothetical protein